MELPQRETDGLKKSIVKAITWRILGTLDTYILSYVVIGFLASEGSLADSTTNVAKAAGLIAAFEVVTKLVLYTLHEQVWTRISWKRTSNGKENHVRSIVKTLSWRIIAFLDTALLAWFFTGSIKAAVAIGGFEVITKLFLYYGHERVWLSWGKRF